jgi:hypothetical protein
VTLEIEKVTYDHATGEVFLFSVFLPRWKLINSFRHYVDDGLAPTLTVEISLDGTAV